MLQGEGIAPDLIPDAGEESQESSQPSTDHADQPRPDGSGASETEEITVWWPHGTGPFRARPEKKHFKKPGDKAFAKPREKRDGKHSGKRDGQRGDRKTFEPRKGPPPKPVRHEKPPDPNSPFAILAAMKAQMTEKES